MSEREYLRQRLEAERREYNDRQRKEQGSPIRDVVHESPEGTADKRPEDSARAFSLGQDFVSRVMRSDAPDVPVLGAGGAPDSARSEGGELHRLLIRTYNEPYGCSCSSSERFVDRAEHAQHALTALRSQNGDWKAMYVHDTQEQHATIVRAHNEIEAMKMEHAAQLLAATELAEGYHKAALQFRDEKRDQAMDHAKELAAMTERAEAAVKSERDYRQVAHELGMSVGSRIIEARRLAIEECAKDTEEAAQDSHFTGMATWQALITLAGRFHRKANNAASPPAPSQTAAAKSLTEERKR